MDPTSFERFLEVVWRDVDRHALRAVQEYVSEFPGSEAEIRAEHARIQAECEAVGADEERHPERVGRYKVLGELDRGGQGRLLRGHDPELDREVAIKTLDAGGAIGGAQALQRLRREARIAGSMQHESICPVLDVVEENGVVFVVLPLVEGENLAKHLQRERATAPRSDGLRRLWAALGTAPETEATAVGTKSSGPGTDSTIGDLRPALRFVEKIARAVHAAHEAGIVHRDLNPRNLMVRPSGEPMVLDFGLALDESGHDETRLTREGTAMGTPLYMAPEQVEGRRKDIGRHTDVYALGVVLYELLTLELPFAGDSTQQLFDRIRAGYPVSPRKFNGSLPADLESVCLRALHVDPTRRYATALELAEDLRRVRTLEPTAARPISQAERLWRHVRPRPLTAVSLAGVVVLAVALVVTQSKLATTLDELEKLKEHHPSLRDDPRSPAAWEISTPRGGFGEQSLLSPRRQIAELSPVLHVGLPASGVRSSEVKVFVGRSTRDVIFSEHVRVEPGERVVRVEVSPPLEPGSYYWWVGDEPEEIMQFEVVGQTVWQDIASTFPDTGFEATDRLARGAILLESTKLFEAAIAELDGIPSDAPRAVQDLRDLLMAKAYAELGRYEEFMKLRERVLGQ